MHMPGPWSPCVIPFVYERDLGQGGVLGGGGGGGDSPVEFRISCVYIFHNSFFYVKNRSQLSLAGAPPRAASIWRRGRGRRQRRAGAWGALLYP